MDVKRSLTGIKPTSGLPHLGNYLGALKPALELQKTHQTFYFIADYHALTSIRDGKKLRADSIQMAAAFLSFGFDPSKELCFYNLIFLKFPNSLGYSAVLQVLATLLERMLLKLQKTKDERVNSISVSFPIQFL